METETQKRISLFGGIEIIDFVVQKVVIDVSRSPQEVKEIANPSVMFSDQATASSMLPRCGDNRRTVIFSKLNRSVSYQELRKVFKILGLIWADPYSVVYANRKDFAFMDEHPNMTTWRGLNGRRCFLNFAKRTFRWPPLRTCVIGFTKDPKFYDFWWLPGIPDPNCVRLHPGFCL